MQPCMWFRPWIQGIVLSQTACLFFGYWGYFLLMVHLRASSDVVPFGIASACCLLLFDGPLKLLHPILWCVWRLYAILLSWVNHFDLFLTFAFWRELSTSLSFSFVPLVCYHLYLISFFLKLCCRPGLAVCSLHQLSWQEKYFISFIYIY